MVHHARDPSPIVYGGLGAHIDQPRYTDGVSKFLGGVAIVINDIDPPVSTDDVAKRIDRMRAQPDFVDYVGREVSVFGLKPADPLFCSQGGKRRISPRRVQFAFRTWQVKAEFDRLYPFHALRHTAVPNVYRSSRDLFLAQRFAMHVIPLPTTL